jgi:hypothetical protein
VVEERAHALCGIPRSAQIVSCVPHGFPQGRFDSARRKPLAAPSTDGATLRRAHRRMPTLRRRN